MMQKTETNPSFGRRIQSLDALRGLAIIAVVVYHATPESTSGGTLARLWISFRSGLWTGVDLFFVLSGFLITRILLGTRENPRYFTVFYARRFLRIFPLYYSVLIAAILGIPILAWILPRFSFLLATPSFQRLWHGQVWLWLYLHNFVQASGPSRLPGMGHLWSLAVEEQFYLIWPVLIWFVPRHKIGVVVGGLLLSGSIARFVFSSYGYSPWAMMHLTWFRLDGLLVGSFVAVIESEPGWNAAFKTWRPRIFGAATASIFVIWLWRGTFEWIDPAVQRFGFFSFSLFAGCIVHWLSDRELRARNSAELQVSRISKVLQTWGTYSYAVYVFHMPVIHAMKKCCAHFPPELKGVVVVLASGFTSFTMAYLSWHFFEKQWLKLKPAY